MIISSTLSHRETNSSQPFETFDLYLAAYLKAQGFPLLRVQRQGSRCLFIFEGPGVEARAARFLANRASISAFDYASSLREMKALTQAAKSPITSHHTYDQSFLTSR